MSSQGWIRSLVTPDIIGSSESGPKLFSPQSLVVGCGSAPFLPHCMQITPTSPVFSPTSLPHNQLTTSPIGKLVPSKQNPAVRRRLSAASQRPHTTQAVRRRTAAGPLAGIRPPSACVYFRSPVHPQNLATGGPSVSHRTFLRWSASGCHRRAVGVANGGPPAAR